VMYNLCRQVIEGECCRVVTQIVDKLVHVCLFQSAPCLSSGANVHDTAP
jgi:hypothetical protein